MSGIDRRIFLVGAGAVAGAATLAPAAARAQEGEWTAGPDLPWPIQEIYAAQHAGQIYVAGGLMARPGEPLHIEDRVAILRPGTGRWRQGPSLPAPRHHPMLIAGDADLYVMGGYARTEAGEWTNTTTGWVLAEGAWKPIAPLPSPQAEAVGVGWGETLHLITGRTPAGEANGNWNDQADTDRHLIYRVGDDRWEVGRPCPMARNSAAAAALDGGIWVAGGRTVSGGGTGRLDRYTPSEDRWDTLAPIPASEATGQQVGGGLALAAVSGRLVAFGGEWFRPRSEGGGGGVFRETWVYTLADDAWTRGPDMRTPRHGLVGIGVENTVYAIAGGAVVSGGRATGVVERLAL